MAQEDREAYIAWLRDEIEKHCNSEGRYEAYWDYNDSITPDQLFNAMEHFERDGYASPLAYLEVSLVEDYYFTTPMEEALLTAISQDAKSAPDGLGKHWDESDDIWGDLEAAGYQGIDANLDDLLSRSSFNVNVFFATEAERNFDMSSIVNAFGNDYREPRLEDVDAEDLDNALSYLVNQQGHSIAEVYGNADNAFIRSVREEINENSSEAMTCRMSMRTSAPHASNLNLTPSAGLIRITASDSMRKRGRCRVTSSVSQSRKDGGCSSATMTSQTVTPTTTSPMTS